MKELPPCEERSEKEACHLDVERGEVPIPGSCRLVIMWGKCPYYELAQIIRVKQHRDHPLAEGTMYWAEGEE